MKKTPLVLLLLGMALLAVGGFLSLTSGPSKADSAIVAQCRDRMRDQGADMLAKCQQPAFATAMTATDANEAARAISAADAAEVGGNPLAMAPFGMGVVLVVFGGVA